MVQDEQPGARGDAGFTQSTAAQYKGSSRAAAAGVQKHTDDMSAGLFGWL